mmetsp:Transcript_117499/g.226659  ORF Transcript_117499/g.226659 Transcript_117499/m.226659 type:complete len:86 (+) Transcript_117499:211-468(+)
MSPFVAGQLRESQGYQRRRHSHARVPHDVCTDHLRQPAGANRFAVLNVTEKKSKAYYSNGLEKTRHGFEQSCLKGHSTPDGAQGS